MKRYIFARNYQEYKDWLFKNQVAPRNAEYISSPRRLEGLRLREEQVVQLPGFYGHPDYVRIITELSHALDKGQQVR